MSLPFICTTYNQCSFNIFNNTQCQTTTNSSISSSPLTVVNSHSCTCPPNWHHDYYVAHYPNCLLPDGYELGAMIFGMIICAIFCSGLGYLSTTLRGQAKTTAYWLISYSLSCNLYTFCIWIQNGVFEAAIIAILSIEIHLLGACISFTKLFLTPIVLTLSMTEGISSWTVETLNFRLRILFFVATIGFIILTIYGIITCRDEDPGLFNALVAAYTFYSAAVTIGFVGLSTYSAIQLEKLIHKTIVSVEEHAQPDNSNNSGHAGLDKFKSIIVRLQRFKQSNIYVVALGPFPQLIVFFVMVSINSFPFMGFVITCVVCGYINLLPTFYKVLNASESSSSSGIGDNHSNNNNNKSSATSSLKNRHNNNNEGQQQLQQHQQQQKAIVPSVIVEVGN
jgi:hypothetical protein